MKKFFKGLLIVLLIAAAGIAYFSYWTKKPLVMVGRVRIDDVINHMDPAGSEQRDDGTTIMHFDAFEDPVFKIIFRKGYPKRIKLYKFYTLSLYFDADGYFTGWKVKENPNGPLLGKNRK